MHKLADLIEAHTDELAAVETLDNGKPFVTHSKKLDLPLTVNTLRYYAGTLAWMASCLWSQHPRRSPRFDVSHHAGWADKIQGKTIPLNGNYHAYSLLQPVGVVGSIIPWNVKSPSSKGWMVRLDLTSMASARSSLWSCWLGRSGRPWLPAARWC